MLLFSFIYCLVSSLKCVHIINLPYLVFRYCKLSTPIWHLSPFINEESAIIILDCFTICSTPSQIPVSPVNPSWLFITYPKAGFSSPCDTIYDFISYPFTFISSSNTSMNFRLKYLLISSSFSKLYVLNNSMIFLFIPFGPIIVISLLSFIPLNMCFKKTEHLLYDLHVYV